MIISSFLLPLIYVMGSYQTLVVMDGETGKPITGCHVLSPDGAIAANTNLYGSAKIYCNEGLITLEVHHLSYNTKKFILTCSKGKADTIFLKRKNTLTSPVVVQPLSAKGLIKECLKNAQQTYRHKTALGHVGFNLDIGLAPYCTHWLHGEAKILTNGYTPPDYDPYIRFTDLNEDFLLSPFVSQSSPDQDLIDLQVLQSLSNIGSSLERFSPSYFLEKTIRPRIDDFQFVADTTFDGHPVHFLSVNDTAEKHIAQVHIFLDVETKGIIFLDRKHFTKQSPQPFFEEYIAFRKLGAKLYPMYNQRLYGMYRMKFAISHLDTAISEKQVLNGFKKLHQTTIADIREAVMSSKPDKDALASTPVSIDSTIHSSAKPFIQKLKERFGKGQGVHLRVETETSYPSEGKSFSERCTLTTSPASQSIQVESGNIKTIITPEHTFVTGIKKNRVLDYPFKDFGYYKHVDVRNSYFEPVSHTNPFIGSLEAFLDLPSITQSFHKATYHETPCWIYGIISDSSKGQDSIVAKLFFRQLDSLPIGMEVYEHKHDILIKKLVEYLPYRSFGAELTKKERLKTVKVKGQGKKRLIQNYLFEEVEYLAESSTEEDRQHDQWASTKNWDTNTQNEIVTKDKYTLLAFWFSSCYYCIQSMPTLEKMHKKLGYKDFQVLGVNPIDIDPVAVEDFLKKKAITYPNTMDAEDLLSGYEPAAYPTYILLGKDGQVLDMQESYNPKALERMVRKHVK